ncbi:hypothetical protein HDE_04226 [Halotydeus destructor]|nr:hypothetical protein HDE_04226 [Halotydeus destructor]
MKKATIFVHAASIIAASYYILTALIDYFQYETVTFISLVEEPTCKNIVVCAPNTFSLATDFDHVKFFLGKYRKCRKIDLQDNAAITPFEAMFDMKIYAIPDKDYMLWHLSRLTLIYSSYPVIYQGSSGMLLYITFEKRRSKSMPAPYDTNCYDYNQYQCIFECTQTYLDWASCLDACSKPGCQSVSFVTLSHTACGDNSSSKFIMEQENMVRSIVAEAKTSLSFIGLNVFGLLGVFFGFSVLGSVNAVWRLLVQKWTWFHQIMAMACFAAALTHCLMLIHHHMRYLHLTETRHGVAGISLPKRLISVCIELNPVDKPWVEIVKPLFTNEFSFLAIAKFKSRELLTLTNDSLREYASESISTYAIDGVFCFLLKTPETRFGSRWIDRTFWRHLELVLEFKQQRLSCSFSVYSHTYAIRQEDVRIKIHHRTTLQITYLKYMTLPHPYKTACQNYGHGHLKDFRSRNHCVNSCALSHFKTLNPDRHPSNIPLFNGSDTSYRTGDSKKYLDSCRANKCQWIDCEEEKFQLYVTKAVYSYNNFEVVVQSAENQVYQFRDVPMSPMSETVFMLMSTIGLWGGISILQILLSAKKIFKCLNLKKTTRKALKKFRHILVIGMLWNIYAAVDTYQVYETLTQVHLQPALIYSPFTVVLLQRKGVQCLNSGSCTSEEVATAISKYSRQSHDLIGRIWVRKPETTSWLQESKNVSHVTSVHIYFQSTIMTELDPSLYARIPAAGKLIATGSTAGLKIEIAKKQVAFSIAESFSGIDRSSMTYRGNYVYSGYSVVYKFEGLTISSLSAPYSDCYDYSVQWLKTQKIRHEDCLEKRFYKVHNRTSSFLKPLPIEKLSHSMKEAYSVLSFINVTAPDCSLHCRKPDCRSRALISHQNSVRKTDNESSITINAQSHETSIKQVPKMIVSEFIMYLGNTFVLWYGLCTLDLVKPIEYIAKLYLKDNS